MMEFLYNLASDVLAEFIIIILSFTGLGIYIRSKFKKQYKKDEEQDNLLKQKLEEQKKIDEEQNSRMKQLEAEFDRKLRDIDIQQDFVQNERLKAYQKIRKYAQKARDQIKKIENPQLILSHREWTESLFKNYERVLGLLHEYALLLEYFNHYEVLHKYKNSLLDFCLSAQKNNPKDDDGLKKLKDDYKKFSESFEDLVDSFKFPKDSII